MKETSEAESRLQSIDAYLTFIEAGTEAGLRALAESTEPDIVESRLRVLIESDRFEDARNVVIALPPHEQWCTQAFIVLARQGDFQGADQLFGWVQQQHNPVLRGKCAVAFAGAAYARAVVLSGGEDRLFPDLIAPESVEVLSKALRALGPVLHGVEANEGGETLLQERAVVIALVASHCMGDEKAAGHYATLLKERTPVPLDLARAVLHRKVPSPPDLPGRLPAWHRDGPGDFEARPAAGWGASAKGSLQLWNSSRKHRTPRADRRYCRPCARSRATSTRMQ